MTQQHSFISYIRNKHSFELTIFGLSVTASWTINFKQYFRMVVLYPTFTIALSVLNKIPKVKLTISNSLIKFLLKPTLALKLKKTVFTFTMKQLLKITNSFVIPKTLFTTVMKLIYKLDPISTKIPKISFTTTPLLAKFYQLWEHDGKTLASMDTQTLQDLDYTIS